MLSNDYEPLTSVIASVIVTLLELSPKSMDKYLYLFSELSSRIFARSLVSTKTPRHMKYYDVLRVTTESPEPRGILSKYVTSSPLT